MDSNCEFCFRILALSSHSVVRPSSSVTSAFMPVYIQILSIDSSIYHVLMTRPEKSCRNLEEILGKSKGTLGEILYRVPQKKCPIAIFSLNLFQRSDYTFSHVVQNQNFEPVPSEHFKQKRMRGHIITMLSCVPLLRDLGRFLDA